MGMRLSNIEDFIYLFQNRNSVFPYSGWTEPIYAAMLRAYQNDEQIEVTIDREIDAKVYELYGLTEEESKIVEGNA